MVVDCFIQEFKILVAVESIPASSFSERLGVFGIITRGMRSLSLLTTRRHYHQQNKVEDKSVKRERLSAWLDRDLRDKFLNELRKSRVVVRTFVIKVTRRFEEYRPSKNIWWLCVFQSLSLILHKLKKLKAGTSCTHAEFPRSENLVTIDCSYCHILIQPHLGPGDWITGGNWSSPFIYLPVSFLQNIHSK